MHRSALCLLLLVLIWALAACGGESTTTQNDRDNDGAEATQEVTLMAGNELKYNPTTVEAELGAVTLILENTGVLEHNITWADETDATQPFIYTTGGQTIRNTRSFASPGAYEFYCTIPGHREAGMVGTLTIK